MRLPRDPRIDSTAALLAAPYDLVRKTCDRLGSNQFETRLLLRKTVCMRGPSAAAFFYDESRFVRRGAMPEPVRATLLGKGGVQGLDGEEHRRRKALFMSLLAPERVDELARIAEEEWLTDVPRWTAKERLSLYDAMHPILMRAVCRWAGVPLSDQAVASRTCDIVALFDKAAALGLGHVRARLARRRLERWLEKLVEDARNGRSTVLGAGALHVIALHRDERDQLLPPRVAAVELLNLLRPTVAVSVYIVLLAHAIHSFPETVPLRSEPDRHEQFVQEVRRFYPFFPAVMARVRRRFEWQEVSFPPGRRVLLDLHGTNLSPEWGDPEAFRPERFAGWSDDPFLLVPQGGGEPHRHHRCPGEGVALTLMKTALRMLTTGIAYDVPDQDLRIRRSRMPALPADRFQIESVHLIQAASREVQ